MKQYANVITAYAIMIGLIILVGIFQSWNIAFSIFNLCLISAVMTMGANIQWGYAGLINFGIMGYTALGGLAAVLVSVPPVREAWQVGGLSMLFCLFIIVLIVFSIRYVLKNFQKSKRKNIYIASIIVIGLIILIPGLKTFIFHKVLWYLSEKLLPKHTKHNAAFSYDDNVGTVVDGEYYETTAQKHKGRSNEQSHINLDKS